MKDIEEQIKKGTTTLGIVCKDGIVLAADRRSSMGYLIADQSEKVLQIADFMAVTTAGLVSDIQLITKLIRAELELKLLRTGKEVSVKEAANLLANILYVNIRRFSAVPGIVAFLLGGKDKDGFKLYELGPDGSILEATRFSSTGSGSPLALGVLESSYKKDLSVDEGIKLAVKAINTAMKRDMPTGDGLDVVTITSKGIKKVFTKIVDINIIA